LKCMMEVKKQNITSKLLGIFIVMILSTHSMLSQFSISENHIDSTKLVILKKQLLEYEAVDWTNIQKNRKSMPIFCKWELDIQDATRMPVKFRLGSQEYVDRLESKGNVIINE